MRDRLLRPVHVNGIILGHQLRPACAATVAATLITVNVSAKVIGLHYVLWTARIATVKSDFIQESIIPKCMFAA